MTFISKPIVPVGGAFDVAVMSQGEPSLPGAFRFGDDVLTIAVVRRSWRTTKDDRGDTYLKRHWYEIITQDGRTAVLYFDRGAKRGHSRWYLYTLE